MHSRQRIRKYYPAVNDTMLSGNFQSYARIQKKNRNENRKKAFYGSFSYLNGKTREQWDQIVYNQTYLSFTKGRAFLTVRIPGPFNKGKYSHLKSYLDPDITNSWSLLNEIDLISFFNKTKVIFFRKTAFNYNAVLNIIFIAALRGEEMSNKSL